MHIDNLGLGISLALGGLGLFLISVKLLSNGLKTVSGEKLRHILKKFTKTNFHSLIFGLLFTTMIQSSDGAVALVISLVAAGFMPLRSALAFVLGANIGTATTSIIVSMSSNFEFTQYFMILAFIGGMGFLLLKERSKSNVAMIIASLGLLFLGLKVMGAGMKTISSQQAFDDMVHSVGNNSWLSTLVSFAMTGMMQSSSASVTVAQNIYSTSTSMSLAGAVGFVVGANIGTTVTAFLTTVGQNKDTKRIAIFWMITNLVMALFVLSITPYFCDMIEAMIPTKVNSQGGYNNFQMAIAHLTFNIFLVFTFFPILKYMTKLTKWIVKEDKETEFRYDANLPVDLIDSSPQLALEAANNAFYTIGEMNLDTLRTLEKILETKNHKYFVRIEKLNVAISESRKALYDYLARLNTKAITELESSRSMKLALASRSQERVSELLLRVEDMLTSTYNKKAKWFKLSHAAFSEVKTTLNLLKKIQRRAISQSKKYTRDRAADIKVANTEMIDFLETAIENHEKRVKNKQCESPNFDYHQLMHMFERISGHQYKMSKYFKTRTNKRTTMKESHNSRLQAIFNSED